MRDHGYLHDLGDDRFTQQTTKHEHYRTLEMSNWKEERLRQPRVIVTE